MLVTGGAERGGTVGDLNHPLLTCPGRDRSNGTLAGMYLILDKPAGSSVAVR